MLLKEYFIYKFLYFSLSKIWAFLPNFLVSTLSANGQFPQIFGYFSRKFAETVRLHVYRKFPHQKLRGKTCILRCVYLSVHFHSCCFYIQYHRGIRAITSMPVKVFCFILTRCRNIRFFYTTFVLIIQKRPRFEPGPPNLQFVPTPLLQVWRFSFRMTLSLFANWNNYFWDDSYHFLKFQLLLPKFYQWLER